MIPLRDVIPRRTRPGVTLGLVVAHACLFADADLRSWWLLWTVGAWTLWIAGSTLEDRLGHARFAVCAGLTVAAGTLVAQALTPVAWAFVGPGCLTAGVVAAHLVIFPRSRVLTVMPVPVGFEFVDIPAVFVALLWLLVQGCAIVAVPWPVSGSALATGWAIAAGAGAVAGRALLLPERMTVAWWDGGR